MTRAERVNMAGVFVNKKGGFVNVKSREELKVGGINKRTTTRPVS